MRLNSAHKLSDGAHRVLNMCLNCVTPNRLYVNILKVNDNLHQFNCSPVSNIEGFCVKYRRFLCQISKIETLRCAKSGELSTGHGELSTGKSVSNIEVTCLFWRNIEKSVYGSSIEESQTAIVSAATYARRFLCMRRIRCRPERRHGTDGTPRIHHITKA